LLSKGSTWNWTPEHQMAFNKVKARLVADPVLSCPDFSRTFTLQYGPRTPKRAQK